jgi:hypothetical protein
LLTDITGVLRDARMAEPDDAGERLGIKLGLLWDSAFLPTTSPTKKDMAKKGHMAQGAQPSTSSSGYLMWIGSR